MQTHLNPSLSGTIKIAGTHGYRIEGDTAFLNAEIAVSGEQAHRAQWALQLWACNEAHAGGKLSGFKVAEAPIELPHDPTQQRLEAEAFARFPAERREYSMVLVLASVSRDGAFEQVHDFANYPERQPFATPHLDGAVAYAIRGTEVSLRADRVCNPRRPGNLSGSLSLDLCALAEPYAGGEFHGAVVATVPLGQLAGQAEFENVEQDVPFSPPSTGRWHMVLMLREWTLGAGFVTRDFCNFAVPYQTPPTADESPAPALAPAVAPSEPTAALGEVIAASPEASARSVEANAAPAKPIVASIEAPVAPAPAAETRGRRVSIQTASVDELAKVKGLTRKLAVEIVKLRPFATLDDLVRVRGIGEKMLRKLREHLTL